MLTNVKAREEKPCQKSYNIVTKFFWFVAKAIKFIKKIFP